MDKHNHKGIFFCLFLALCFCACTHAPAVTDAPKAVCDDSDVTAGVNANNHEFWSQLNQCASNQMVDKEQTTACIRHAYPGLSKGCGECFGQMASCVAASCIFACMIDYTTAECRQCLAENCHEPKTRRAFNISKCTGLSEEELPPGR